MSGFLEEEVGSARKPPKTPQVLGISCDVDGLMHCTGYMSPLSKKTVHWFHGLGKSLVSSVTLT